MIDKDYRFKRANFFTGLLATPKFWNEIEEYRFSKEVFYNMCFHGMGIVEGVLESLKVTSLQKNYGTLTLVVHPGCAIDAKGRGIFLYEPQAVILDVKKFKLPCAVYIVIRHSESMQEFYQSEENPDFQGYKKREEGALVEIVDTIKHPEEQIELARVYLSEDEMGEIREIGNSDAFADPGTNVLDYRYVPWISRVKLSISPYLKKTFIDLLDATRNVAITAYDTLPLGSLREIQMLALNAKMIVQCGNVSFDDTIHLLEPFLSSNGQLLDEMLEYERVEERRVFTVKDDFEVIRKAVCLMADGIKYYDMSFERLDSVLSHQRKIVDCIKSLVVSKQVTAENVAVMSHDLPRVLLIGDDKYTLIDFLDQGDRESVEKHALRFEGAKDVSTANQSASYPDGIVVKDTIKRYVGGNALFSVRNASKGRKLLLVRRTDIYMGNYSVAVTLNDRFGRSMLLDSADTKDRWRNLSVTFEEDEIETERVDLSFGIGESGRDNFGRMWVYQRL